MSIVCHFLSGGWERVDYAGLDSMLIKVLFWILVAVDLGAMGLFLVLGLAAAGPSHTNPLAVVWWMAILPGMVLGLAILLFVFGNSWMPRGPAFLLVAAPLLILVVWDTTATMKLNTFKNKGGAITNFAGGAMQELEKAIIRNDAGAVATLAKGADLNQSAISGSGVLVVALRQLEKTGGPPDVLRALLAAGANPNSQAGELPLAVAIQVSRKAGVEPVKLLLAAKANPNARGQFGEPTFFGAAGGGVDPTVLPLLLDGGADLSARSSGGNDLLLTTAQTQNWAAALVLLQRGVMSKEAASFRAKVESATRASYKQPGLDELVAFLKQQEK